MIKTERTINENDILMIEHEMLNDLAKEWLGVSETPRDDVQYICGIIDLADKLIHKCRGEENVE